MRRRRGKQKREPKPGLNHPYTTTYKQFFFLLYFSRFLQKNLIWHLFSFTYVKFRTFPISKWGLLVKIAWGQPNQKTKPVNLPKLVVVVMTGGAGGSNRNAVEGEERCESRRKILVNSGSKGIKITTWTTFPGHVILAWLVFCLSLTEFNKDFAVSFNFTSHLQLSSPKEDGTASLVLSGSGGFWCHAYVLSLALVLM